LEGNDEGTYWKRMTDFTLRCILRPCRPNCGWTCSVHRSWPSRGAQPLAGGIFLLYRKASSATDRVRRVVASASVLDGQYRAEPLCRTWRRFEVWQPIMCFFMADNQLSDCPVRFELCWRMQGLDTFDSTIYGTVPLRIWDGQGWIRQLPCGLLGTSPKRCGNATMRSKRRICWRQQASSTHICKLTLY